MNLFNVVKSVLNLQKKIPTKMLPSQGLFYKDDFELWIKKADVSDIIEYEYGYEKDDIGQVIGRLKKIVEKNTIVSKGYSYSDIKSVDIVFIFFEIVRFTNNKQIDIKYFNDSIGKDDVITFDSSTFNYTNIDDKLMKKYDIGTKEFVMDGFRYSIPSIGIENSLTQFLISKSGTEIADEYNKYSYDFLYFLGHKTYLNFDEIDNLIQIFNSDLSDDDKNKIKKIVKSLSKIGKYSLKKDSKVIDVTSKIDLEKIWK